MTVPPDFEAKTDAEQAAELLARLREAEETLEAIRTGQVDAVIVSGAGGPQIYTLESADRPYRLLVEQMQEGALTLNIDGRILYCNRRFADLIGRVQEEVLGLDLAGDHIGHRSCALVAACGGCVRPRNAR